MPSGGRAPRKGWENRFLKAMEDTHLVSEACKKSGASRAHVYRVRQRDPLFAQRWAEIEERSTEVLEQIAVRRAAEGSDVLMIFLLKARRPSVYRDNIQVDHHHVVDGTLTLLDGREPVQINSRKRREAARLLLGGGTDPDIIDVDANEIEGDGSGWEYDPLLEVADEADDDEGVEDN